MASRLRRGATRRQRNDFDRGFSVVVVPEGSAVYVTGGSPGGHIDLGNADHQGSEAKMSNSLIL